MAGIKINHFLLLAVVAAALLASAATASRAATVASLVNTASMSETSTAPSSGTVAAAPAAVLPAGGGAANATAYDMMAQYGFPAGILPAGVQGYTLNQDDGSFQVTLPGDCVVDIDGYRLRYRSQIYGNVRAGSIDGLDGVSVKIAIVWVGIHDVEVDGGDITFHAGAISKSSPTEGLVRDIDAYG